MTTPELFALSAIAGFVASGVNTVAGGGSLISFPLLTGLGLAPKIANATNSVGLWPGSLSGAIAFLHAFKIAWPRVKWLLLPTLIGALLGAVLLLITPSHLFDIVVPFLILFAVGLLAFQKQIKAIASEGKWKISRSGGWFLQLLISIYGGYFGAGMGIMMLAALSLYVEGTIHDHNAVKNWLSVLINFSITFVFVWQKLVVFSVALPMIFGSIFGGYIAGRISQRVDPDLLRKYIVGYGLLSAVYFGLHLIPAVRTHLPF